MDLPLLVLTAILAWHPSPTDVDLDRYKSIAAAIGEESQRAPLWSQDETETLEDGAPPSNVAATALLLVAVGQHESGLLESVRRCKRRGDTGRSIGIYQVIRGSGWQGHTAEEICGDDVLQAKLALAAFHVQRDRCPKCEAKFLIRAYASGNGGTDTKAARQIEALFERALTVSGLEMARGRPRYIRRQRAEQSRTRAGREVSVAAAP